MYELKHAYFLISLIVHSIIVAYYIYVLIKQFMFR